MDKDSKLDLTGKVAVVTGASKGIGKAIARLYGLYGAKVVVSSRKQDVLDAVVREFKNESIDAVSIAANAGDVEELKQLVEKTVERYGGIDILVNNAAANPVFGPLTNVESWAFDKIVDVNLRGPFELGNLAYKEMVKRGGGVVINISSVEGLTPGPFLGIYSMSKAGLISLTKSQAREWGADNIRVNAICPGLIKTKFSETLWGNEQILNSFMEKLPLPRVGEPVDIAGMALFLASDYGSYCTGGVFTVDGGYTI